jgi:uncharacterized RDD family membrane protein YckC
MTAEATALGITTNKAGFWIRTFAYIIDGIGRDSTASSGLNLLLGLAYFAYFWSAQGGGQTLGMRVFNLKVVRTDGSALTITQALIRYIGLFISFVCLFIGVIWVAFDADKQGWHDKIAGTYVIRTK